MHFLLLLDESGRERRVLNSARRVAVLEDVELRTMACQRRMADGSVVAST